MEINEGKTDRAIRLIIGLVAIGLALNYSAWWYVLAIVALITAFIGFCGLYKILGISTLKTKEIKAKPKKKKL